MSWWLWHQHPTLRDVCLGMLLPSWLGAVWLRIVCGAWAVCGRYTMCTYIHVHVYVHQCQYGNTCVCIAHYSLCKSRKEERQPRQIKIHTKPRTYVYIYTCIINCTIIVRDIRKLREDILPTHSCCYYCTVITIINTWKKLSWWGQTSQRSIPGQRLLRAC